jgi:hypothetical protein
MLAKMLADDITTTWTKLVMALAEVLREQVGRDRRRDRAGG